MKIKKKGFTSVEIVISLFVVSMIVYVITFSMNNGFNLINKAYSNKEMLSLIKEGIEDERSKIKNSTDIEAYNKNERKGKYIVETEVRNTSYLDCYSLNLKVISNVSSMELNTYVTAK